MDIYIQSEIGVCTEYMPTAKLQKTQVSICVSPLKLTGKEGDMKFAHGCNMFKECHNKGCYYSMASRKAGQELDSQGNQNKGGN